MCQPIHQADCRCISHWSLELHIFFKGYGTADNSGGAEDQQHTQFQEGLYKQYLRSLRLFFSKNLGVH